MKDRNATRIGESLANSVKALASAVKSLYKMMPVMMIVFVSLGIYLSTLLAFNTTWMVCILSFVIVVSSICIYSKSNNYGEAVLSLSAGLLTVYTVSWTFPLFVGFIVVWLLFTLIVLFIASVRLASKLETIYMESSFSIKIANKGDKEIRKILEGVSKSLENSLLMPDERAEVIRLFCFSKLSIENMPVALKWVNLYYSITKIPYLELASFVVAVIKSTIILEDGVPINEVFDFVYTVMRDTPISPKEFMEAFIKTKYILVSSGSTILYFESIKDFYLSNKPYDELEAFLKEKVDIQ